MTSYAQIERHALADLFDDVGPDAPTLCGGWKTADLAAHLVVREHRPDAAVGIAVGPLAGYTARVQRSVRDGSRWPDLVERVRSGPPLVLKALDVPVNTVEFFVHHEDVRRAAPGWAPRELSDGEEGALWARLGLVGRMLFRRSPVGVRLQSEGHGSRTVKAGDDEVTVTATPGELTLFGYGRQAHARVELAGPEDAAERLQQATLGM